MLDNQEHEITEWIIQKIIEEKERYYGWSIVAIDEQIL